MREHKYKAWDKISNQMKVPIQIHFDYKEVIFESDSDIVATEWRTFDDCILIEYTGLKDKNFKEIYESDLVKFYHKGEWITCEIIWNDECAMYCLKWSNGYINKWYLSNEKYEVVGNIYEGIKES